MIFIVQGVSRNAIGLVPFSEAKGQSRKISGTELTIWCAGSATSYTQHAQPQEYHRVWTALLRSTILGAEIEAAFRDCRCGETRDISGIGTWLR